MKQTVKALVLGGGGAKGSYQIGVWQALQEQGWYPDIITGTSIGSLNGAMFAVDKADALRDMWLVITDDDVLTLPKTTERSQLRTYLRDVVLAGGMDVAPLEKIIDIMLDEEALRNSKVRFGLVTVEVNGFKRKELPIEEIPTGKVKDYLLASAACFPTIRPKEIDGKVYLDGGFRDNLPFELAVKMGATELFCASLDAPGLVLPNFSDIPTKFLESYWDLGELFKFSNESVKRNIALGYYDTLRVFEKVRGTAYAIDIDTTEFEIADFRVRYDRLLIKIAKHNPTVMLAEVAALLPFNETDKPLAPLEYAAQFVKVPPTELYTVKMLSQAFLDRYDAQKAEKYMPMLVGTNAILMANASVNPEKFISAIVYMALREEDLGL